MGLTSADLRRAGLSHLLDEKPAKRRKKPGTGDWSERKRFELARMQEPGIFIPVQTRNEANGFGRQGGRWGMSKRRANVRDVAGKIITAEKRKLPPLPVVVTFVRYGPKEMDSDGCMGAMKPIRDALADAYGTNDKSDQFRWTWPVKQEHSKYHGVRLVIEPRPLA